MGGANLCLVNENFFFYCIFFFGRRYFIRCIKADLIVFQQQQAICYGFVFFLVWFFYIYNMELFYTELPFPPNVKK